MFALAALMAIVGWDFEVGRKGDEENFSLFMWVGFGAIALVAIGLPMIWRRGR